MKLEDRDLQVTSQMPVDFLTQLRAMLLANAGLGNLQIMFPMVASLDEVDAALALLDQAYDELLAEHATLERPTVGIMVEVPSAVYLAPELLARVDFLSVGTNDLTQYLLAVDRDNARVAGRFDSLHPAVLRALADVARHARAAGKGVGICGEMAGEPEAVPLLVGMGYDNLSASPGRLPAVKALVRAMERTRAEDLARRALGLARAAEVRALVVAELESMGLARLLGPGHH